MNLQFKEDVWRGGFRPTAAAEEFEDRLRGKLGLTAKYDSARLSIGRSLAETTRPDPLQSADRGKSIAGEFLFGDEIDLWLSTIVLDGELGVQATVDDFRTLVEAHWARGARLLEAELSECGGDEVRFLSRLADLLPETQPAGSEGGTLAAKILGEMKIPVGSVSKTHPGGQDVEVALNAPGVAPHIALMGKNGSGKTTTGVQLALDIVSRTQIPFLFIDPKGEFVNEGRLAGRLADSGLEINAIEVGRDPIPLDFLPDPSVGSASISLAAMQFRDSLALCCGRVGDVQQDILRTAVEKVIKFERRRDLPIVKDAYRQELDSAGKGHDSIMSRLNELTQLKVFSPEMSPAKFFGKSWVLSLKALGTDELKRIAILLLLDSLRSFILSQPDSPAPNGFRSFRHLLVIDEARRILAEKRYQSLVDLLRQGRSKGQITMLLSQDPSDFEGQADDFTTQLGTVIAFACSQGQRGLRSLQGAYGRRLQPQEFSDTFLPSGVAFAKLPGREPERVRCWGDVAKQP
jgi:hypothetical protein